MNMNIYNVKGGAFALFSLTQIHRSMQVYLTKQDHSVKICKNSFELNFASCQHKAQCVWIIQQWMHKLKAGQTAFHSCVGTYVHVCMLAAFVFLFNRCGTRSKHISVMVTQMSQRSDRTAFSGAASPPLSFFFCSEELKLASQKSQHLEEVLTFTICYYINHFFHPLIDRGLLSQNLWID